MIRFVLKMGYAVVLFVVYPFSMTIVELRFWYVLILNNLNACRLKQTKNKFLDGQERFVENDSGFLEVLKLKFDWDSGIGLERKHLLLTKNIDNLETRAREINQNFELKDPKAREVKEKKYLVFQFRVGPESKGNTCGCCRGKPRLTASEKKFLQRTKSFLSWGFENCGASHYTEFRLEDKTNYKRSKFLDGGSLSETELDQVDMIYQFSILEPKGLAPENSQMIDSIRSRLIQESKSSTVKKNIPLNAYNSNHKLDHDLQET